MEVAALIGVNQKCPSVAAEVIAATLRELQSVTIAFHCVLLCHQTDLIPGVNSTHHALPHLCF